MNIDAIGNDLKIHGGLGGVAKADSRLCASAMAGRTPEYEMLLSEEDKWIFWNFLEFAKREMLQIFM